MKYLYKFRHRLLVVYGLLLLLVLGGTLLFVYTVVLGEFRDYVHRKWQGRQERAVSWISTIYRQHQDWLEVARLIRPVLRYPIRWVRVTDMSGKVLLSMRAGPRRFQPPHSRRGRGMGRGMRRRMIMDMADCMGQMPHPLPAREEINSFPLHIDGKQIGRVDFLALTFSHRIFVIDRIFSGNLNIIFLTAGGLSLLVFIGAGLILSRSVSRPLEYAAAAVRKVKSGQLNQRLNVSGPEEISLLADSFNRMVAELQEREELQKKMSSDIAHELRTPVTILKTHLEGMRDGVIPVDNSTVLSLLEETGRLERIIVDLRSIWDLEQEAIYSIVEVDINLLLADLVDKIRPLAEPDGITLELNNSTSPAKVSGDVEALQRTFLNLLNNAVKYAGKDGRVRVTVSVDQQVVVTVSDSGPGLPESELERVFERFYRLDPSRNRQTGGAGLGLAIAKEAVHKLHGSLQAGNDSELGGALFTVQLPPV